jgi:hypothetical protein
VKVLQSVGCTGRAAILLYGVVGLLLLGQYSGKIINYFGSTGWEQVDGVVVGSEIVDEWDTTGDRFLPVVTYEFTLNDQTYTGNQIDLRGPVYVGNEDVAASMLEPYPVGSQITLFADPSDPSNSVITRAVQPAVWWFVGIGAGLLVLAIGLGVMQVGGQREKSSASPATAKAT